MKKKLIISFSGGRTSAYMLWWLLNEWDDRHNWEIIVVFANTGKEVEGTLFFVDECSQEWGVEIIWVEAKCKDENGVPFSEKGWSVKHRVVTYETASRNGEPFEEMISVLGIPSGNAPFCSKQLKRAAIESYASSIRWDDYKVAVGIRFDEDRPLDRERCLYPFIDIFPTIKRDVIIWFNKQPFNLEIHPDDGNCDNCYKKGETILVRNMVRKPDSFLWWEKMTTKYGYLNPRNVDLEPPFNFFRGNKGVVDIRELAKMSQAELKQLSMFDEVDPCNESCEVY
jgi:hypothetical protein